MPKPDMSKWKTQEFKITASVIPGVTIAGMERLIRDALVRMYMEQERLPLKGTIKVKG